MKIVHTCEELDKALAGVCLHSREFVPTMGALHAGHISLVRHARGRDGTVVASVFVNPTQFNDREDLRRYPRTPESDLEMLREAGADVVFMPSEKEIYPEPDSRVFDFGLLDKVMEGATRPGHFNGVAQVVSRLFDLVRPARAYFSEKDFQQVAVVREMVRQMAMPVEIVALPTVREADGLAMSSRNALLTEAQRVAAPLIYKALTAGAARIGEMQPAEVERFVTDMIDSDPALDVIYFNLVNRRTLERISDWAKAADGVQGCVAVRAGNVRLIDNLRF